MNISQITNSEVSKNTGAKTPDLDAAKTEELMRAARDFEAAFLAEALGHMGFDSANGVAGATEFSSMLNRAYAERLADRGGVGLSENIFRALAARNEEAVEATPSSARNPDGSV